MYRLLLMLTIFGISVSATGQNKVGFDLMVNSLISNKVDTISSKGAAAWIKRGNTVVLDARERTEFEVSHLHNAQWVGFDDFKLSRVNGISKSDTILIYCSVGKRSGDVAEELQADGYKHVYNLYGGIFDWTNRGMEVVNVENESVKYVHPYNSVWGYWVNNYEKTYEPR